MRRREFLSATAAAAVGSTWGWQARGDEHKHGAQKAAAALDDTCHCTYASPAEAMKAPREKLAYVPAIYVGTDVAKPDYLAVVDVDPASKTYSQVVHRTAMPSPGDELHHFGWNACSSCHGDADKKRRYLVVPGLGASRIHFLDTDDPAKPKLIKTIEKEEIVRKTKLTTPHTVHCLPDGQIMISMLGDADGNGPGGFLLLDQEFKIVGRWERDTKDMKFNYDFWYQPRHGVMISSEWAAPNTVREGFKLDDVKAGKYGKRLLFWDWKTHETKQVIDLGEGGMIPLEIRCHHNPASTHGFVGAALSSAIWHFDKPKAAKNTDPPEGKWRAEKVIQVDPIEHKGWPFPVPGLITDVVLSLDDRWLYFSNWLHGDIRQYDVSDPAKPKLTGQAWLGGVLGRSGKFRGGDFVGGPQMLQLSLDGRRLYVTSSLYSKWDNQFYPDIAKKGSYLLQLDCDTAKGGLKLNERFYVDFGKEPAGAARAHEIRFPGGDSTSDIWV
jgi:selenium-binding protein 1